MDRYSVEEVDIVLFILGLHQYRSVDDPCTLVEISLFSS